MLLGLVVDETGLIGALGSADTLVCTTPFVRALPSYTALPFARSIGVPFVVAVATDWSKTSRFGAIGGGFSSMGDRGGGGISVPSVNEKLRGVNCGSSKSPLGLPLTGIVYRG